MFVNLFYTLKKYGVPVSTTELLDLNSAIASGVVFADREAFYRLVRMCMVKDEKYFDKFDRAMTDYFDGIDSLDIDSVLAQLKSVPPEWLLKELEKNLSAAERAALEKAGSLDELMRQLAERLKEQHKRHQGGNKMVGTGGTSPFGAFGDHPEGVRIGGPSRKNSAVKVWEQRQYQNLDDTQRLGTRQIQVALRRLRKFARVGAADELDIGQTIDATARQGMLDIQMVPERRNRIKVLIFFDVGGSMDPYVAQCEKLFTAAKSEFKTLEYFYFHNCLYDYVWKDNMRRGNSRIETHEILRKYGEDYRVIFVGDASMAPYELFSAGGSVEYANDEPGVAWLTRMCAHFKKTAWLNPEDESYWDYTQTVSAIKQIFNNKMYALNVKGLEDMTKVLAR